MRSRHRREDRGKKLIVQPERLFALRLAKATGRLLDADRILDEIDGPQLAELAAFDRLEGIDNRDRWQRLERILTLGFATVSNLLIVKGEKIDPDYFLPPASWQVKKQEPPRAASVQAQKAFLRQVAALHNRSA